jgi:hypothetical protein
MIGASAVSLACAVCYGGSEDPLVKGAAAGVAVLGGFIFFVLVAIGILGVRFGLRARQLAQATGQGTAKASPVAR